MTKKEEAKMNLNLIHKLNKVNHIVSYDGERWMNEIFIWDLEAEELSKTIELNKYVRNIRKAIFPAIENLKSNPN